MRASGQRTLADIVSIVRYAIGGADELTPFSDGVRERFQGWLAMQETAGRAFTEEQVRWLEAIRDHIVGSVSMEMSDFQYAPFNRQGGLGKAYELFGDKLEGLLEETEHGALVGLALISDRMYSNSTGKERRDAMTNHTGDCSKAIIESVRGRLC